MTKIHLKFLGAFLIALGAVSLAQSANRFLESWRFTEGAIHVDATYIGSMQSGHYTRIPWSAPFFTFRDSTGVEREVYCPPSSFASSYPEGSLVRVLYRPEQLPEAREDSFSALWMRAVIFASIGIGLSGCGLCCFRRCKPKSEQNILIND